MKPPEDNMPRVADQDGVVAWLGAAFTATTSLVSSFFSAFIHEHTGKEEKYA